MKSRSNVEITVMCTVFVARDPNISNMDPVRLIVTIKKSETRLRNTENSIEGIIKSVTKRFIEIGKKEKNKDIRNGTMAMASFS